MRRKGISKLELFLLLVAAALVGAIIFSQVQVFAARDRDNQRKNDINQIYYYLTRAYHPAQKSYPINLKDKALSEKLAGSLTDPNGLKIGDARSDYRYEAYGCDNTECEGFSVRSTLEQEADFVRSTRVAQ